jgi:hypothetical protein
MVVEFLWFCVELHWMANFDHPFLPHLNSIFAQFLSPHHLHRCVLFALLIFRANKGWDLGPILQKP